MDGDEERIIESGFGSPILKSRTAALLVAALLTSGSLAAAVVIARRPPAMRVGQSPSPSPLPTSSPPGAAAVSFGERLIGQGPFVVYTVGSLDGEIHAVDLGAGLREINLGRPPGEGPYSVASQQTWGTALPLLLSEESRYDSAGPPTTRIWSLTHGGGIDDAEFSGLMSIDGSIASPDGSELLALKSRGNSPKYFDLLLVDLKKASGRWLGRVLATGGPKEEGTLTPIVWLPGRGWLAVSICDCDYAGPRAWYAISPSGKVARAGWLGVPTDLSPGVSSDGRYMSYIEEPKRDCGVKDFDLCPDGPLRVLVADTTAGRVREIARFRNVLEATSTVMSPDGSRIAIQVAAGKPVYVLDAKTGAVLANVGVRATDDTWPVAFIDSSSLLLSGIPEGSVETHLLLARIEGATAKVTTVARNVEAFLGWVR